LFYELLVLMALSFVGAWLYVWLVGDATDGFKRLGLQLFVWGLVGCYFVLSWVKKGQSLAMKSWKLKLIQQSSGCEESLLSINQAVLRYCLASVSFALFGFGFFWSLTNRKRLFLHDFFLNTQIVECFPKLKN
jgi:uncharacterized RDD family membrane protein YckC